MTKNDLRVTGRPVGRGNPAPELLLLGQNQQWMKQGLCINHPDLAADAWFSEECEPEVLEAAKKVCQGCDVQLNCAKYARANGEQYGVWGGYTALQLTDQLKGARKIRSIAARKEEWTSD